MSPTAPKLSYHPKLMRVTLELCLEDLFSPSFLAEDFLVRAQRRLEKTVAEQKDHSFFINQNIFQFFGKNLKNLPEGLQKEKIICITLGQAFPVTDGIMIKVPSDSKPFLVIEVSEKAISDYSGSVYTYDSDTFFWRLQYNLAKAGLPGTPNHSHVDALVLALKRGEAKGEKHVGLLSDTLKAKSHGFQSNKTSTEISFYLSSPSVLLTGIDKLIDQAEQTVKNLSIKSGVQLFFRREHLAEVLTSLNSGPEILGLGLPRTILVAVPSTKKSSKVDGATSAQASKESKSGLTNRELSPEIPEVSYVGFDTSQDKKRVTLNYFDKKIYDATAVNPIDHIEQRLKKRGFHNQINPTLRAELEKILAQKGDINGFAVLEQIEPTEAKKAFIALEVLNNKALHGSPKDIRTHELATLAQTGQWIASRKFEIEGKLGLDIYGKSIPYPEEPSPRLALGDGVEEREPGHYYATIAGVPKTDGNKIFVEAKLLHEGDVSLKSGNISFSGSAEITGSIEKGVIVEIGGDLVVRGMIRGGFIRCNGHVEVHGGIVNAPDGLLKTKGNLTAGFIENSVIQCGGNLIVRKTILNSQVGVLGTISVDTNVGLTAGGIIRCKKSFRTAKLGVDKGQTTILRVGVDFKAEDTSAIRERRLNRLNDQQTEKTQLVRDLNRKKGPQKTDKILNQIKDLTDFLARLQPLIEKAKKHLKNSVEAQSLDKESKIYVHDKLLANCTIEVGGTPIPISSQMAGVEIASKRRRGSFIHALEAPAPQKAS